MQSTYKDKLALVTSASSGIGEWFARHLADQGADLILAARRVVVSWLALSALLAQPALDPQYPSDDHWQDDHSLIPTGRGMSLVTAGADWCTSRYIGKRSTPEAD